MTPNERMAQRQSGFVPDNVSLPASKKPIPKWTGDENRSESRASSLSKVERRIVKRSHICKACADNNDPNKVPVHPNCDCDVVTDSIDTGVADPQSRFLKNLRNDASSIELETVTGNKFTGEVLLDPETVSIMDSENVRFSDLAKWLEYIQPYLDRADRVYDYVSIAVDDDNQDAVDQVQEEIQALSEGSENFAEAIRSKKLWFALAKAVAV